ncbi:type II toxin-antitoxin system VapC family toxin [Gluconacetobacter diazotrophicus]|uniref:type II toxin-antitoxin system VapC family toxin n=1 Tax=Gluconacetobacter diazotrophicus TaxID=33996 RepID=UPI00217FE92A|nr:type II toxin-antitoxin system VapC family toxin [Gluconacetobacter diazotrophicus]
MIVVDTSAIIAIFRQEPEAAEFATCIGNDDEPVISAATMVETSLVLRGLKQLSPARAEERLDEFVVTAGILIEPVAAEHAVIARDAHIRFGKGDGPSRRSKLWGLLFLRVVEIRRRDPLVTTSRYLLR